MTEPAAKPALTLRESMERAMSPDPTRSGIFQNHSCAYCDSGNKPCRQGHPNRCDYPHARND